MKIQFVKPTATNVNVKATIHINGKLGFSKAATKKFSLDEGKFIKIGVNSDDESDNNLYVIIKNFDDGESLKIHKSGQYYFVNTKQLFDSLNIDYKNNKIIYDVEDFEYSNIKMHKFVRRELSRRSMEQVEEANSNEKEEIENS